MRDEQGNINSIVVVMTDITDSAELRDKLVHAEKMAAVGHRLRRRSRSQQSAHRDSRLCRPAPENPSIPDSARKDLRVILQEAQRTKQIVQNLLELCPAMPSQRAPAAQPILRRTIQLRSDDFNSHGVECYLYTATKNCPMSSATPTNCSRFS